MINIVIHKDIDSLSAVENTSSQITLEKIAEAKAYLTNTDWIVIKLTEYVLKGDNLSDISDKYQETLAERDKKRALINSLE